MAMPNNLVLVRHGESEANFVHGLEREGIYHEQFEAVYSRPDWQQRLSIDGVNHAISAGKWLNDNDMNPTVYFDRCYASTFMRARETARYIGVQSTKWILEDRIKERDWGVFGSTPKQQRDDLFPKTSTRHELDKWHARLDGGESLADNVLMRGRDFQTTLHRDLDSKNVLVVCHGEFMLVMRYLIERMLPEEVLRVDKDKSQEMKNCTIIHYSRENPYKKIVNSDHISWMRIIYPYDIESSPFNGEWQNVSTPRVFSADELDRQLENYPPLIERTL